MALPISQISYENGTVNFNRGGGTAAPTANPAGLTSSLTTGPNDYSERACNNPGSSTSGATYKLNDGNFPVGNLLEITWSKYFANTSGQKDGGTNTIITRTVGAAGQGVGVSFNRQQKRFDMFVHNSSVGDFTMVEGNSISVANIQPLHQDNVQGLLTYNPLIGTNGIGQFNFYVTDEGVPTTITKVLTYNVATITTAREAVEMDTLFNGSSGTQSGNKIEDLRIYDFVAEPKIITGVNDFHEPASFAVPKATGKSKSSVLFNSPY